MDTSTAPGDGILRRPPSRRSVLGLGLGALVLATSTGCTGGTDPARSSGGAQVDAKPRTFTFGTAAASGPLDPALAVDTETLSVTRQIFEGLVGVDPDTGAPTPALATAWTASADGLAYTFTLREGVRFHDGTPFDADAVVANFTRWATMPAKLRKPGQAFEAVFRRRPQWPAPGMESSSGGSAGSGTGSAPASYYKSCTATGSHTVVLRLNAPITGLVEALTLPGFGIASPAALEKLRADSSAAAGAKGSAFGRAPVGTGPYTFGSRKGSVVVLRSRAGHWRGSDAVDTVKFAALRDPASRLRALRREEIDGYDLVTVDGLRDLVRNGEQVIQRDPFSVLYLGMNTGNRFLARLRVRQAVARAVDRQDLIGSFFISGTKEARSFVPPSLGIPDPGTAVGHSLDEAKTLLEESGYDGEPIPFAYPLNTTRAYLPLPERIYARISRQLTAAGFTIKPVPIAWEDGYLETVQSGSHKGFHLLGINGAYRDPDNFLGPLFGGGSAEFGYKSAETARRITAARSLPEGDERTAAYQEIGERLAADLPALPIAYPISALALSDRVVSYPSSPVLDEVFDRVVLTT